MEGQGAKLAVKIDDFFILNFIISFYLIRLEKILLQSLFNFWGIGREEWSSPLLVMKYSKNIVTI